jgi:hypothetical protein
MTNETPKARELCPECGGVMVGPTFWVDEAPKDAKLCRRGRIVFSGAELDGEYRCDGTRFQSVTFTSGDVSEASGSAQSAAQEHTLSNQPPPSGDDVIP